MGDIWARRPDGVEIGLRAFEVDHPVAGLAGSWAVVVRPGPQREYVLFGPATEAQARAVARQVWTRDLRVSPPGADEEPRNCH